MIGPEKETLGEYNCNDILTHQFKHVFWVLKRTVSMSWVGRDQNFYTFLVVLRRKGLMRKRNDAYL